MKRVMQEVKRAGEKMGISFGMGIISPSHCVNLYQKTEHLFKYKSIKKSERRKIYEALKWKTYYNALNKYKWKLVVEFIETE